VQTVIDRRLFPVPEKYLPAHAHAGNRSGNETQPRDDREHDPIVANYIEPGAKGVSSDGLRQIMPRNTTVHVRSDGQYVAILLNSRPCLAERFRQRRHPDGQDFKGEMPRGRAVLR
jgi:hypothetical protein